MDSRAAPGHAGKTAFSQGPAIHLCPTMCPSAQEGSDITHSPGPRDRSLPSCVRAKCIFVGLSGDWEVQAASSTFLENSNMLDSRLPFPGHPTLESGGDCSVRVSVRVSYCGTA